MARTLLAVWILLTSTLQAQTLGEALAEIREESSRLLTLGRQTAEPSWGQQTALADLEALQQAASALSQQLEGDDAKPLFSAQRDLSSSVARLKASAELLPGAGESAIAVQRMVALSQAVDQRLTELRLRFDQKASRVPGTLAQQSLESNNAPFDVYENPRALLIDVRDARQLASSLQTGRFPPLGYGMSGPNNLDPIQVQRLIQAGWALQRALEGQFDDISQVRPWWDKFFYEYDRLGYPGSNTATRQLDRVMERLGRFFDATVQPARPEESQASPKSP